MLRTDFKTLLSQLKNLTHLQKQKLLDEVNENANNKSVSLIESQFEKMKTCPHCQSQSFSRRGKSHDLQRYRCKGCKGCKGCKKTFNALTGTPMSRLRQKAVWLQYSECLNDGLTIRKSAEICDVDNTTSFRWRHRFVTNAAETKNEKMVGIVEADETFFGCSPL